MSAALGAGPLGPKSDPRSQRIVSVNRLAWWEGSSKKRLPARGAYHKDADQREGSEDK